VYAVDALLFRVRWHHLSRIPPPEAGAALIAINHLSAIDTTWMGQLVWDAGRHPHFLVKAEAFGWPLIGRALRGAGQIPVHRGTVDAASSLDEAAAALSRGDAVVIYPEGTVTKDPDHWPMRGRTGIARLVLSHPDVPVLPVGQWGAQHRPEEPWWRKLRRRRVEACVGEPLDFSGYRDRQPSGDVLREITDRIMSAIVAEVAGLRGETPPPRADWDQPDGPPTAVPRRRSRPPPERER
jgi:1-acyl-sn-glycerol-3-phosphate acyltransferase